MFPSSGRDVGEVNCRKLRGSGRGPAPVILRGRNGGRRPVNHTREGKRSEIRHRTERTV